MIRFKNLVFDVNDNQVCLREENRVSDRNRPLVAFLKALNDHKSRMPETAFPGLIIYADDQFINQEMMKMNIQEIKIENEFKIFSDGLQTITFVRELLKECLDLVKALGISKVF